MKNLEGRLHQLAIERSQVINFKTRDHAEKDKTIRQLKADLRTTKARWDKEALARIVSDRLTLDQEELAVQQRAALRIYEQAELERDAPLIPLYPHRLPQSQPFVVVLVDGDGYRVRSMYS